jgi:hypothetical protein
VESGAVRYNPAVANPEVLLAVGNQQVGVDMD